MNFLLYKNGFKMVIMSSLENKTTPMMEQWLQVKKKVGEALLFFRLGDFYEAFYEDASIISRELDLTLTKRQEVPMCGVPYHTSDSYVDRLVAKGYKVAIADQTEDPKQAKGLVKRELTRIVTPATVVNSSLLAERSNNFFASLTIKESLFGLAVLDLTTADFKAYDLRDEKTLFDELSRLSPKEILISKKFKDENKKLIKNIETALGPLLSFKEESYFEEKQSLAFLQNHLGNNFFENLEIEKCAATAAGALLLYLGQELCINLSHIKTLKHENLSCYLELDHACLRNLEILEPLAGKNRDNTLLYHLDKTFTPMGGRLLHEWVRHPLLSSEKIKSRQNAIEEMIKAILQAKELESSLVQIRDLERIMMKISTSYASPKDIAALRHSLKKIPALKEALQTFSTPLIREVFTNIKEENELLALLERSIVEDPPFRLSDGGIFKAGFNVELDELRLISHDSRSWIASYQNNLRLETGIKTLRVGYTKAFGYYIEVSAGQKDKIPPSFQRRQTLVNSERFLTEELKHFEEKILSAEEKLKTLESILFSSLRLEILNYGESIKKSAKAIAIVDVLLSLCLVAKKYGYVRPIVEEDGPFIIKNGRHPIIEKVMHGAFVPNDVNLDDDNLLMLITGPNMSGKSTYIRQVALTTIMAQIGSFVPADYARLSIVDRVFARIGASDDLAKGQSTFMVEMSEASTILKSASSRSLVILDEIGRGTSTYDGISIAWAIAEYLLTEKKTKTLFATHYWELTELEEKIKGAKNFNVAVIESEREVSFLRKIIPGGTDKSYGIHVAKLAGLPETVIKKAEEKLKQLENSSSKPRKVKLEEYDLFTMPDPALQKLKEELKMIDLNTISPIEAHLKLFEIKTKILT